MSNVIGFKGTADERRNKWLSMRNFRQYEDVFAGTIDAREIKIKERHRRIYKDYLGSYVKKAA